MTMGLLDLFFGRKKNAPDDTGKGAARWPADLPSLDELVKQLGAKYDLPASLMVVDPDYHPEDPKASWLGRVIVGRPGEAWPVCQSQPMVGICQINLTEVPCIPEDLKDLKLITVFMAADKQWSIDIPDEDDAEGTKWVLRAYDSLEALVPYPDAPATPKEITPCAVRYQGITDLHPNPYEFEEMDAWRLQFPEEIVVRIAEAYGDRPGDSGAIYGSKLGGWPAPIQDPIARPLAFQLGTEDRVGLHWYDSGCIYFWRERNESADHWSLAVQFY